MDAQSLDSGRQDGQAGTAESAVTPQPDRQSKAAPAKGRRKARMWWLKQLHTWHWVSAAVSLIGMMLFAITGITLNHAASISATPQVTEGSATLPAPLLTQLEPTPKAADAPLPAVVADHLRGAVSLDARGKPAEWSEGEVYVALPGPGRDAWISIDRASGEVTTELTNRGWISYFNDLHKGRNSGTAWFWFIDVFAGACIVFTITGLFLLQLHAKHRPSTWPMVGLGLLIPLVIAILFIH